MLKMRVRQILLVIVSILSCYFSVGYIFEIYNSLGGELCFEYTSNMYIDGSDFTPLFNFAIAGFNGFMMILTVGLSWILTTVFILIFAIIMRVMMIRKNDTVVESELTFANHLIIISSVIAVIMSFVLTDIRMIIYVICFSWQQPLFMWLIYYKALNKQYQHNIESKK